MASRLRDGKRLPSVRLMKRIAAEFDVSIDDLVRVHTQGSEAFGELLRDRVFGDTQPVA